MYHILHTIHHILYSTLYTIYYITCTMFHILYTLYYTILYTIFYTGVYHTTYTIEHAMPDHARLGMFVGKCAPDSCLPPQQLNVVIKRYYSGVSIAV